MLPDDLFAAIDRYNAGEPIPPVSPGDIYIALDFLADLRSQVRRSDEESGPAVHSPAGILLEDLAERCGADTDVFALSLRVSLFEGVLEDLVKSQFAKMDTLVHAAATISFQTSELNDLEALKRRLHQIISQPDR